MQSRLNDSSMTGFEWSAGDRRVRVFALLLAPLLLLPATAVRAQRCGDDPIPSGCRSYAFTAEVTTASDPGLFFEALTVGDTLTGTITLDMDVEDVHPDDANGYYPDALQCATVDFPSGRSLEVENDLTGVSDERYLLVENDRPQPLGGGFSLYTDDLAATTGGTSRIVGGLIPDDEWIPGAATLGYGYSKGCLFGVQTPCPPTLLSDDSIPGPPGDVAALDAGLLEFRFQELVGPGVGVVFSDLLTLTATAPVRCPEPGLGIGVASGGLAFVGYPAKRRRTDRSVM